MNKNNIKTIVKYLIIFFFILNIKADCSDIIAFDKNNIKYLLKLMIDPRIRGFLTLIAVCEGTRNKSNIKKKSDLSEYQIPFLNQEKIHNLSEHPNKIFKAFLRGKIVGASASGRYQFIKKTWFEWLEKCPREEVYYNNKNYFKKFYKNLHKYYEKNIIDLYKGKKDLLTIGFGPFWQDFYAICLLNEVDAINDILNKNYKNLFSKVSQKWSTISYDTSGRSRYEDIINHAQKYHVVLELYKKHVEPLLKIKGE